MRIRGSLRHCSTCRRCINAVRGPGEKWTADELQSSLARATPAVTTDRRRLRRPYRVRIRLHASDRDGGYNVLQPADRAEPTGRRLSPLIVIVRMTALQAAKLRRSSMREEQYVSIYRGWRPLPQDVHAARAAIAVASPLPTEDESWRHLRRAQPVDRLLPRTKMWLAEIPEKFRPTALASQFPRIANALCATWNDAPRRGDYLEDLLTGGRRRNRKGFPASVHRELQRLGAVHTILSSLHRSTWEAPGNEVDAQP